MAIVKNKTKNLKNRKKSLGSRNKKTILVLGVVCILFGAMFVTTVSAQAGIFKNLGSKNGGGKPLGNFGEGTLSKLFDGGGKLLGNLGSKTGGGKLENNLFRITPLYSWKNPRPGAYIQYVQIGGCAYVKLPFHGITLPNGERIGFYTK